MKPWNPAIVIGWLAWISLFLTLDVVAWLTRDPAVPTFSRVITKVLPWWLVVPAAAILTVHLAMMYRK